MDYPTERLGSFGHIIPLFKEVGNYSIERSSQRSLFHIILSRFILGFTLLIPAFYFGQFQHISRYHLQIIGSISLSYQHILHLQGSLRQTIFILYQRIVQLKQIQLGNLLTFSHYISILYPYVCHHFRSTKIQVGIILRRHFPVTDQLMIENLLFERHHRHLIG